MHVNILKCAVSFIPSRIVQMNIDGRKKSMDISKISSLVPTFARRASIVSTASTSSDPDLTKPLKPGFRPRALSIPLENPQKVGLRRTRQMSVDQIESILFRLPFELREQIYRYVLGGKCIAQDAGGNRIGDRSDPWPAYEKPGGERRGIRPWGYVPNRTRNLLSLLLTCRQIYSEAIDILYSNNLFYFRNPITNWSFSTWRVLPKRLEQVRIVVLDETIGDPSIVFSNRKQWNRIWRTLAKMTRLKVLYLNVDTLYPKVWGCELEKRLLCPLAAITQVSELCVILRWCKPASLGDDDYPSHMRGNVWRLDEYKDPADFYAACPPAEMRDWIVNKLFLLESGDPVDRTDIISTRKA